MQNQPRDIDDPAASAMAAAATKPCWPLFPTVLRGGDVALLMGFMLSGVASVGLELVWIRILGLAFGSESFGMLGVLAGFFAGLALGAAVFHRFIRRSRRPSLIYVAAEIVIAAYALTGPLFMLSLTNALPRWLGPAIGDNGSLAALSLNLVIATVLLLPATVCMGATTIAVVEAWQRRRPRGGNANTVAWLYAVNTFGATVGVALCIYLLLPTLGVATASASLGVFSVAAAALIWYWQRVPSKEGALSGDVPPLAVTTPWLGPEAGRPLSVAGRSRPLLYALLFFTGLAGIGLEAIGTHVLAQIFENTVHTFANILAVYLLGTATGAWLYAKYASPRLLVDRDWGTSLLLYGLTVTGILAGIVLGQAAILMSWLAPAGCSYTRSMVAEALISALVFVPPTVLMGATFSHLAGYFSEDGIGYASAFNTLGAALAPFVFGLILLPSVGYGATFYGAVGTYLLLFLVAAVAARQNVQWIFAGVGATVVVGSLTYSSLVLIAFPTDYRLVAQRVSLQGVVSVTERGTVSIDTVPERILWVDQRFPMGGTPGFVTKRMGQLPILIAEEPRDILYLGVGTGITAGSALNYSVQRVTGVELIPQVLDMLPWFDASNNDLRHDRRVTLHASDARRFIEATRDTYDVIVADLYHPNRDGTGSLYTTEHFANIRARLRDGGLFVQWLPLYQLRPEDLKTIVRTFLAVFPGAQSMIGNYSGNERFALLGWGPRSGSAAEGPGIDVTRAKTLLRQTTGGEAVFDGIEDVLASYMLDTNALRRYAGTGPVNTDINQKITFDAAGNINRTEKDAYRSLATLLAYRTPFPDNFIRAVDPHDLLALREDVGPYADAVSHYLGGEVLRLEALPKPIPPEAIAEYLKAYEVDPRVKVPGLLAEIRLLDSALQNPAGAEGLVLRLWSANPHQANIESLRMQLQGVAAPRDVRAIISRFREQVLDSPNP